MNDFLDSAHRHFADATLLDQEGRVASASHFYGVAGECVLKALMLGLSPITHVPKNIQKHVSQDLWSIFITHSSTASFPQRISACIQFQAGYQNWQIHQRYWNRASVARRPKLANERVSARGLMSVLDQVQRGLL